MRIKQEILANLDSQIPSILKCLVEVVTDIRDILADREASTQEYRAEVLRFKRWELDKL